MPSTVGEKKVPYASTETTPCGWMDGWMEQTLGLAEQEDMTYPIEGLKRSTVEIIAKTHGVHRLQYPRTQCLLSSMWCITDIIPQRSPGKYNWFAMLQSLMASPKWLKPKLFTINMMERCPWHGQLKFCFKYSSSNVLGCLPQSHLTTPKFFQKYLRKEMCQLWNFNFPINSRIGFFRFCHLSSFINLYHLSLSGCQISPPPFTDFLQSDVCFWHFYEFSPNLSKGNPTSPRNEPEPTNKEPNQRLERTLQAFGTFQASGNGSGFNSTVARPVNSSPGLPNKQLMLCPHLRGAVF